MFTVPYDDYASSLVLAGYGKQYTEKLADEIILRFYPFLAAEKNSSSRWSEAGLWRHSLGPGEAYQLE